MGEERSIKTEMIYLNLNSEIPMSDNAHNNLNLQKADCTHHEGQASHSQLYSHQSLYNPSLKRTPNPKLIYVDENCNFSKFMVQNLTQVCQTALYKSLESTTNNEFELSYTLTGAQQNNVVIWKGLDWLSL